MPGARLLASATIVFVLAVLATALCMQRYGAAYGWVSHTSDVRLVIGRAIGHSQSAASCAQLDADLAAFASLTADNPVQQARVPGLRARGEDACAHSSASAIVAELAAADQTERSLLAKRRARLDAFRRWTLAAIVAAVLGAVIAVLAAWQLQRRGMASLTTSEERFRMLAATSRDLIRIHDADGRATYASPSAEPLLGYTPAELLAIEPLSLGHPDDLPTMREALASVRRPGAPGSTLRYRLRAKDGSFRWFETHTNPVRDPAGRLLRFYTTARDITGSVELEHELEQVAITDELTGLLNRRGFLLLSAQQHRMAIRQRTGLAVVYADLDGLKTINDRLGHEQGDVAIRRLADVLRATFRASDVIARLGGDELAVLAYDVDDRGLSVALERMRASVAGAPAIGPYPFACSVGFAVLAPGAARSLEDLLADADARMYEDKRARKAGAAGAAADAMGAGNDGRPSGERGRG